MPVSAPSSIPTQNPAAALCDELSIGGFFAALVVDARGVENVGFVPTRGKDQTDPAAGPILADVSERFRNSQQFRDGMVDYLRNVGAVYVMAPAHDPHQQPTVVDAVVAHSRAVQLDEACFSDAGELIVGTQDESDARLAVCNALLRQVVETPCRHPSDVQLKVDYLLNGTVGDRPQNVDAITGLGEGEELNAQDGPVKAFLRSLLLGPSIYAKKPAPDTTA